MGGVVERERDEEEITKAIFSISPLPSFFVCL
jgi:hypothetical protein